MSFNDALEDYKKLIKAVIDYSVTSYVKLQHPSNRSRKSLHEDFLTTLDIFFDEDYTFENFVDLENNLPMTTKQMISFLLGGVQASMTKTQTHIIEQSIEYWWTKHFHDMKVPSIFTIAGKVWKVKNSPHNKFIDWDNNIIYTSVKSQGADRDFYRFTLLILLKECDIDIPEDKIEVFFKFFYLLLKVNNAFPKK